MKILFLTHRLPYAPNRGDRVRSYHMLRLLAPHAEVHLVSFVHDEEEAAQAGGMSALAAAMTTLPAPRVRNAIRSLIALPSGRPTTHTMLDAPGASNAVRRIAASFKPDVVLAYCTGVARLAFEPTLRNLPLVVDFVDVDSEKWAALAASSAAPRRWIYAREARTLARFEAVAAGRAFASLVTTEKERRSLASLAPNARIEVVPNGVDVASLRPTGRPSADPVVVFCGVMNYAPNEEGALWLAREVWPAVRLRVPGARLQLVGSNPTPRVQALAARELGIEVTGHVPDVRPYLWQAAVSAAPLLTARGVQNKVLEAVAAGLPAVVTPVVRDGLPSQLVSACSIAETAQAFATALADILDASPEDRRKRATSVSLEALTWESQLAPVPGILRDAAQTG